jgi:hypothetical protein
MQMLKVFTWIIGYSLALFSSSYGQVHPTFSLLFNVEIKGANQWSIDRRGQFYIADAKGNIWQYSPQGQFQVNYSPVRQGSIHTLEAWSTQNPFAFYQDYQDFLLFDRFLVPLKDRPSPISDFGFVRVATVSGDNHLWIVDDMDLSLKKIDPATGRSTIISPLNLLTDAQEFTFSFIREYQNKVFLVAPSIGILLFDNMGNYERTISIVGVDWIGLEGNTLQYVDENQLVIMDLYSEEKESLDLPEPAGKAFLSKGILYILNNKGFRAYKMN